jgi:hypothetical protein
MGAGGALQQQAVVTVRTFDIGRVFLDIDLARILDVAQLHSGGVLDVEMRRLGCLRLPGSGQYACRGCHA